MECNDVLNYDGKRFCKNYMFFLNENLSNNKEEIKNVRRPINLELFLQILEKEAKKVVECNDLNEQFGRCYNIITKSDLPYFCCSQQEIRKEPEKVKSFGERVLSYVGIM